MAGYKLLKRKGLDDVADDFSDFPLSSPATKIRRLDAELPPIAEVDVEQDEPLPIPTSPTPTPIPAAAAEEVEAPNEERALVLFKPLIHSSSPFSLTVNSDLISEFKNQVPWSKQRDSDSERLLRSATEREEEEEEEEKRNRGMALVPWVPSTSPQLGPILHEGSDNTNTELMEADQMGEEGEAEGEASMMMDIEQQQDTATTINASTDPTVPSTLNLNHGGIGGIAAAAATTTAPEGFHQWQQQQQHCLLPQLPQNMSTPITWTR